MKAVIMAGGEGTRLRPATLGLPKPMVPLFDRPVMEHIIALLKRHGITDICVTLQYMPQVVESWFGDGSELGVQLTYFIEQEPLGTAGSVKNCMEHLGDEDFLVISGDAVCDLDLAAAMGFHRASRAEATLVLYRHSAPLEYGLVLTDDTGRVERFIEKPGWGQVFANTVNTGIYVLTRGAMDRVPQGTNYDFGKDLFPRLLEEGAPLYGHIAEGYWCDMGDCRAYLDCAADALGGKVEMDLGLPHRGPGIWAAEELPAGITVAPPCWIGPGAIIEEGAMVGPHAVVGKGAVVGRRSLVQRSVLMEHSRVADRCTLYGAVLCRGARVGAGSVVNEGVVLGAESTVGENCILMEGMKVWPHRKVEPGARLTASLVSGGSTGAISFGDGGVIRGSLEGELSPELLMTIGGVLGGEGKMGLGHSGGNCAQMLARCAGSGGAAAGAQVLVHDGGCPAAGAWAAERYALPASLFVEQEGERIFLHFFDRRGLAFSRARQRKLEGAILRGEVPRASGPQVGPWEYVTGLSASYAGDVCRRAHYEKSPMTPVAVSVPGESPADHILRSALEGLGCIVLQKRTVGVPGFATEYGGLRLTAWDEEGTLLAPERLLTLVSLIELENGSGRVALPAGAPEAVRTLAQARGGEVLALDRDGAEAEDLYATLPWLRDGIFGGARICARLGQTGERLSSLMARCPKFVVLRREVPLHRSRGEVMQALAEATGVQAGEGVRIQDEKAMVWLAPLSRRASLRVAVEAANMEDAEELCRIYQEKVRELDKQE